MVNYTWKVANYFNRPSVGGLTNVVFSVGWTVTGERDGQSVTRMGVTELPPATEETFVAWSDVTDELALEWVRAQLDAETGLSIPDVEEVPSRLGYILANLELELDNLPPVTVVMPSKTPVETDGGE